MKAILLLPAIALCSCGYRVVNVPSSEHRDMQYKEQPVADWTPFVIVDERPIRVIYLLDNGRTIEREVVVAGTYVRRGND